MTEKVEQLANALDKCDKEALRQIANTFGKLQRWYVVPWDQVYGSKVNIPTKVAVEEQTTFKVMLFGLDASKRINLIREIKANTSLSLTEARQAVDTTPVLIKDNLDRIDAEKLKAILETAGGTVEIS